MRNLLGVVFALVCSVTIADPYAVFDSVNDGSAAARAGTQTYNAYSGNEPLPVHGGDGDTIKQTLQNMGSGQTAKEAWKDAAESAAGVSGARREGGVK